MKIRPLREELFHADRRTDGRTDRQAGRQAGRQTARQKDMAKLTVANKEYYVDKENQLDVTFCIFYFSSNSCSTCFGQPCANHQKLTTA